MKKIFSIMSMITVMLTLSSSLSAQTFSINDNVANDGTLDLGNIRFDVDGFANTANFTLKGVELEENVKYTISMTNTDASRGIIELQDETGMPVCIPGYKHPIFGDTPEELIPIESAILGAGLQLKISIMGDPALPYAEFSETLKVVKEGTENALYIATIKFSIGEKSVAEPTFSINGNVANEGIFELGNISLDQGFGESSIFRIIGTDIAAGDYFLDFEITNPDITANGAIELHDAADMPLYIPGNPRFGMPADAAPISADSLLAGQTVKLYFSGNPQMAYTECSETLKIKDSVNTVLYTATIKFSIGEKSVAEPTFSIVETNAEGTTTTYEDGATIELGSLKLDKPFQHDVKYVIKGENVTEEVMLNIMTGASRYTVELRDANNNPIVDEMFENDKKFTAEQINAGIEFYLYFDGMSGYEGKNLQTKIQLKNAEKALFAVTYKYSFENETFNINDTVTAGKTLALTDIEIKNNVAESEGFTLKGSNVTNSYVAKITSDNEIGCKFKLVDNAGNVLYAPATDDAAAVETEISTEALTAGQTIKIRYEGKLAATTDFVEDITVCKKTGEVLFTAKVKFTIKSQTGTGVENVTLDGKVWSEPGMLFIEAEEQSEIKIFTVDGKCLMTRTINAGLNGMAIPAGMYIVTMNGTSVKAVVR